MERKSIRLIKLFLISILLVLIIFFFNIYNPLPSVKKPSDNLLKPKNNSPVERLLTGDEYKSMDLLGPVEIEKVSSNQSVNIQTKAMKLNPAGNRINCTIRKYRKKIVLNTQYNNKDLKNYIISINVDSLSKIRDSKLSLLCDHIYFTEEDGQTIIPHWLEYGCGRDVTKLWLRIPSLKAHTKKTIYMYYSNEREGSLSDFKNVFQQEPSLVGWYYFDSVNDEKILDFSGHGNNGTLSRLEFGHEWGVRWSYHEARPYIFFNDWQKWYSYLNEKSIYFTVPAKNLQTLSNTGSIEVRVKFYNLTELITEHIFTDSKNQIEFGKLSNGNLYFRLGNSNNRIVWNTRLNNIQWYHLVISWNIPSNEIKLFVNGKEILPIPSSKKFNFTKINKLENLEFGGYYTGNNYGLCGFLDCLRIYDKPLTAKEASLFMNINQRSLRFLTYKDEKEELIYSNHENYQQVNFSSVSKYPISDQLELNLIYASPLNEYYYTHSEGEEKYLRSLKEPPMIIDRTSNYNNPIFGFSGHFFSYTGTEIQVKNVFYAEFVGLKIDNPGLIRDLKIEFSWLVDYSQREYYEDTIGLLDYFLPSAKACGPFYSYKIIGDSELELVSITNGIYWFRVVKPIYIDPSTCVMQISFKPNYNKGNITIELSDMIFMDKDLQLVRPKLVKKIPTELKNYSRARDDITIPSKYKATFPPIEEGVIYFKQNKKNGLDIVFENRGLDTMVLNNKTFDFIEHNLFKSIHIYNSNDFLILDLSLNDINFLILDLSLDDLKDKLMYKSIESGYCLHFQILPSYLLEKNKYYYITFAEGDTDEYEGYIQEDYAHLTSWILGKDPYRYNHIPFTDSYKFLYKFIISDDGTFSFYSTLE